MRVSFQGDVKHILFSLVLSVCFLSMNGSNPVVSGVALFRANTTAGTNNLDNSVLVKFNVSWESSWRINSLGGPNNWDAVWVFVKYRISGGEWQHARLDTNIQSHSAPVGGVVSPSSDGMGCMVYRDSVGVGSVNFENIALKWNYGVQGELDSSKLDVKVFAIEMVYIPEGMFYLGDGTVTNVRGHLRETNTNIPYQVINEGQLTLGGAGAGAISNNNAAGMYSADDFNNSTSKTLPAEFPKGFNAVYCMKYELSQSQWIDFFNTLTTTQKSSRDITSSSGKYTDALVARNNVNWVSGDATLNGGSYGAVACNYLSWADVAAYLDWSGLRPMTELEFEKICKGPSIAVVNSYAWGNASITQVTSVLNSGTLNEIAGNSGANAQYGDHSAVQGALRVGIFANPSTSRVASGASYYGLMDLSGGLWERVITIGNSTGRTFAGQHGNGGLSVAGDADVSSWPSSNAIGVGYRGGGWRSNSDDLHVADRFYVTYVDSTRFTTFGCRGVRTWR